MKKRLHVRHQHRYLLEVADLYNGEAEYSLFDDYELLTYKEADDVLVKVYLYEDYMQIHRHGEIKSKLSFKVNQTTKNLLITPYGDMEIELFTYNYRYEKNKIILEYDILSSNEEKDGYRIEFIVEEGVSEFH